MVSYKDEMTNGSVMEANFTVDKKFRIVMGDEHFYRIMGDKTLYTFDKQVYHEDLKRFNDFVNAEKKCDSIIIRCICDNDAIRWFILSFRNEIKNSNGEQLMELQLKDINVISKKFDFYLQRVIKYRSIMNLIEEKLFEYNDSTGVITIYCYINNRSEIIEKDDFTQWKERMLRNNYVGEEQRDIFERLCDNIKSGTEQFQVTLKTAIMSKGEREDVLTFKGETIYNGTEKIMTVGTIKEHSNRMQSLTNVLYDMAEINKDGATGLLNKKTVTKEISNIIDKAKAEKSKSPIYLMVLDIDDFKQVNDTYGHMFGDEVIQHFANVIRSFVDGRGIAGRIGGDEFMILLEDVDEVEEVKVFLKALRKRIKLELNSRQPDYMFSTSIGISQYPENGDDYETLFKIADGCLYIAKEKGKDRYIIYDRNRHGDIINMAVNQFNLNYCVKRMKPVERIKMLNDISLRMHTCKKEEISNIMAEVLAKTDIDGITIYKGVEYECIRTFGEYNSKPQASYLNDKIYKEFFDENGINKTNNSMSLAVDFPEAYKILQKNSICSFLQMKFNMKNGTPLMVECDMFGTVRRKWNDEDVALLYGIMRVLSDVFEE